jgi:hypothetical protein
MVPSLIAAASSHDYVAGTPEVVSFRYMDGPCFRLVSPRDAWVWKETKLRPG